jgi:hypothetical protein
MVKEPLSINQDKPKEKKEQPKVPAINLDNIKE